MRARMHAGTHERTHTRTHMHKLDYNTVKESEIILELQLNKGSDVCFENTLSHKHANCFVVARF